MRLSFKSYKSKAKAKTFCTKCGKKLTRTIARECFDNGFHNLRDTLAKNDAAVVRKATKLERQGTLCRDCIALGGKP